MAKNNSLDTDKQILVVEASAGSGKTYALARRYLKLLLNASAQQEEETLRSILAITFMNKAAVEMKERILELLKRLALDAFKEESHQPGGSGLPSDRQSHQPGDSGLPSDKPEGDGADSDSQSHWQSHKKELLAYIGLDEKTCRVASFRAMQEIIRRYDYFQVQTIDSFINALLLGCAFRLGLSANFNIREDYNKYIASSLDLLLDLAAQKTEVKKLFLDFVWHYLSIENRGGWLAKNDILSVAKSLFSEFNRYGVPFYIHPVGDKEIIAKKNEVYQRILKIDKEIDRDGVNKTFARGVKDFAEQNDANFQLDRLKSASWQKEEIPCNKGASVRDELNEDWNKLRAEIRELCEMEAYSLFNPYIQIFNKVFEFFLLQSQKENILFLEELNSRARQLFGKGTISVPEIYYRIGSRFRHFLIDEFQDTSVLQWNNIFILAEEALSTGGTLFYVGDKKQAIYRFRGGEAELFDGVRKELGQFGQKEDVLGRNYRSSKEIVEFNNRVFSPENLKRFISSYNAQRQAKAKNDAYFKFFPAFEQELLQVFLHSEQEPQPDKPAGYVSVERFDGSTASFDKCFDPAQHRSKHREPVERLKDTSPERSRGTLTINPEQASGFQPEARRRIDILSSEERSDIVREKLLGLIEDLRSRSFDFKDIAVLSRSGDRVEEISNWLIEEGIPVESEKTLNIRENSLIKEIVSFLKFLDSPIDDLAFASFILGEIFCAASGLPKEKIEDFIFRNRMQKKKEDAYAAYLYRAFQKEFPQEWQQHIEKFFKNVGFLPLYEMLVTIYADFSVLERFPGNQSFFMSFLELVKEKEDEHNGIKAFLEYLKDAVNEDVYVKFPAADAVKVMTVHKAKGLEFPAVIIPFLKINPKAESTSDNRGISYTPDLDRKENTLRLLRLKEDYRRFSEEIRIRYNEEYFRSFLDELNNVYVSFTRAKQELYIFMSKKPGSLDPAELLIPWLGLSEAQPPPSGQNDFVELGKKGKLQKKEVAWAIGSPTTALWLEGQPLALSDGKGALSGQEKLHTLGPSRYSDWIDMLKDEFKDYAQLKFHKQIKKGEVMHYIFSLLGDLSGKDADAELSKCLELGQSRFPEFEDFPGLEQKIKALLKDPRFKELFFCEGSRVFTEKEVVNRFGDTKRIDRLILKDDEAVIIDFKSGTEEEGQPLALSDGKGALQGAVKQLKEYIELIRAIYPGKKVRGCLLWLGLSEAQPLPSGLYVDELLIKEIK